MTEAAEQTQPKRRRKPKSNSLHLMKELTGLMEQRTAVMAQIAAKRMELAQLQVTFDSLGTEIQWRAGIFGLAQNGQADHSAVPIGGAGSAGVQFAHSPGAPVALTPPIFAPVPQPPAPRDNVNRAMADLGSLT
jgi:hypothetical protein